MYISRLPMLYCPIMRKDEKMDFSDGRVRWRQSRGRTCRIAVCGDICPAYHGEAEILAGKSPEILAELLPVLENADLRIAQWEVV